MALSVPEVYSIETPDGDTFLLNDDATRAVLRPPGNWGFPPIEWDTFKGYKQDGLTEIGYTLSPRSFAMAFTETTLCREDLWTARARLLDQLRPNRTAYTGSAGQHILTVSYNGGQTLRSIYCRFNTPVFPETQDWAETIINEPLQVTCFDPVWFDPTLTSASVSNEGFNEKKYPVRYDGITYVIYGADGYWATAGISYVGTWYSYPVITVTGPFSSVTLRHMDTGAIITLNTGLANSQSVTFDIEAVTATQNDGTDLTGFLSPESDFVGFRLEPDNIAPGGVNTLRLLAPGYVVGQTTFTIAYYTRYIGI